MAKIRKIERFDWKFQRVRKGIEAKNEHLEDALKEQEYLKTHGF